MLDGVEFGQEVVALVRGYVERELAPLKAENESLALRIAELEARPAPEKGEKGDRGEKGDTGNDGANGKDGAGIIDGFLSREGHLIATLSDGSTKDFGEVVGKDGRDGRDGEDARTDDGEEWGQSLTLDEKVALASSILRKELGDRDLIELPDSPAFQASPQPQQPPIVVHNHLPKRGVEKTVVTKHDERGRILEFERREA